LMKRAPNDRDAYVDYFVRVFRMIGSPAYQVDEERLRERAAETFDRCHHPAGTARQLAAILASGSRRQQLRRLALPTLVIHGEQDPLVPLRAGQATARAIPGADLLTIPGMGHDLPRELWPTFADAIAKNADRAAARAPA
jgi:pimeloyl-ACP methyl ester carboxylesterase